MSKAIQFYGQSAGLHRQLIESVLAYANLGQAKYPNEPEWKALHKVATDNMADLSKLLDGQIRAEDIHEASIDHKYDRNMGLPYSKPRNYGLEHTDLNQE